MKHTIKAKNFTLRPYRKGDEKSLIKNINDRNIYRYTLRIPYPYGLKEAKKWLSHSKYAAKKKNKAEINFSIDISGEVVGGIGISNIKKHKAEMGYWLGKKYWSRGIMTQAVGLVTDFGFKKLKLRRIYAHIFLKNKASARVLEKNRYKKEGLMKNYYFKNGKLLDAISYAKTK